MSKKEYFDVDIFPKKTEKLTLNSLKRIKEKFDSQRIEIREAEIYQEIISKNL